MSYIKLSKLLVFTLVLVFIFSLNMAAVERSPRININAVTDAGLITQAGILYPFKNSNKSLWYTDLRARLDNDQNINEWNIGLGYRKKLENELLGGLYLFKDRRKEFEHYWDMWTLGGEILSANFDLRANAYLADNEKLANPSGDTAVEAGGRLYYQESFYRSLDGFDFEIGKRWTGQDNLFNNIGLYARFYKFFADDVKDINGKELKINKEFGRKDQTNYELGLLWQDDNYSDSSLEATFAVSIPFGGSNENESENVEVDRLEARMTEAPKRDLDIVVAEADPDRDLDEENAVTAKDPATGRELGDIFYVTKDGDGKGTKSDPANILDVFGQEAKLAAENDIIVLLGEHTVDNSLSLKKGQKLLSPGGYLWVSSDSSGSRNARFEPEGKQAILLGDFLITNGKPLIILNNNTTVSGLDLRVLRNEIEESFIYGNDLNGSVSITNNYINKGPDFRVAKIKSMASFSPFGSGIHIEGELNEQESLELNIINNKIATFGGEALKVNLAGRESVPEVSSAVSSLKRVLLASSGSFRANIKDNEVNFSENKAFGIRLNNIKQNNIVISDNSIKNVLGRGETKAISVYNSAAEQKLTNLEISNNIIGNIISHTGTVKGIEVENKLTNSQEVVLNTVVENNIIKNLNSGLLEVKLRPTSLGTESVAYLNESSAIAVINEIGSEGKAVNTISKNQIEGLTVRSLDNYYYVNPLRVSYQTGNINGIYISNYGPGAEVENNLKNNSIKDINLGRANKGIYILNSETPLFSAREVSELDNYLDSAVNIVQGNRIEDIISVEGSAAGILIKNKVSERVENQIEANKITKLDSSNLRDNVFANALTIYNFGSSEATAKNSINKNDISDIEAYSGEMLSGILLANENFENVVTQISDNTINKLAFKVPLSDRRSHRSPIIGFSNFESNITNSSLIIRDNTFSNTGNIIGSAAITLNNIYNSTYNGDYLIENNNFRSSYFGILISAPESDEIRAEIESKNNFERGTVYRNIIFYSPYIR